MAKINHFIIEYTDSINQVGVPTGNGMPPKVVIRRFLRMFRQVDDIRIQAMIDYPLEEIILIAFLAVLGNASNWAEMERFGKQKERWLKKFINLKNGIPSHDTFRRVFSLIDTKQLQDVTIAFLLKNLHEIKRALNIKDDGYRQICVDGKEQRGTGRKYQYEDKVRNLQTLHVYDASNALCLYSQPINEKTNEIPVAQDILKEMNLKDCIVSFDALHMQKNTVAIIRDQKGHYIGGLKTNQGNLYEEAFDYFKEEELLSFYRQKGNYYETIEKAHGQIEKRTFYLVKAMKRKVTKAWKGLKSFICYVKEVENLNNNAKKTEIRYYATSLEEVELCAQAIRGHWAVENNLHWHLDYSLNEDDNTTMDKTAFHNYSLINKMVLSLCKLAKPIIGSPSIRTLRKELGWGYEECVAMILSSFDAAALKSSLEIVK
ncbi:DDE Tnp1-associated [Popillia japonica]|uniref:DDE Tnp1-associated n=1 Tax=Popillia japonica TaxID=7064 RepID=A0AAW1H1E3_POPJA